MGLTLCIPVVHWRFGGKYGQQETGRKSASCFLLDLLLNAEDGASIFLRNVSELPHYIPCDLKLNIERRVYSSTVLYPTQLIRLKYSISKDLH
jgi:hypothetical protein